MGHAVEIAPCDGNILYYSLEAVLHSFLAQL